MTRTNPSKRGYSFKYSFQMVVVCLVLWLFPLWGWCQDYQEYGEETETQELTTAYPDIDWHFGPYPAKLDGGIAEVYVPMDNVFINGKDTRKLMNKFGNVATNLEVGLVASRDLRWFIIFEFSDVGYIKDDEKDTLDSDALLKEIKAATREDNKQRAILGHLPLEIIGWETEPLYNEFTNNLEWAVEVKESKNMTTINHNTRVLGRKGYMSATLVTDYNDYQWAMGQARECMKRYSFTEGNKYEDYESGDSMAGFGLSALISGGAGVVTAKGGSLKYIWILLILVGIAVAVFLKVHLSKD